VDDFAQVEHASIHSALIGGIVFNLANILLTAAIAGAGMAVAFPIGIGLASVIGVIINYRMLSKGDPVLLFFIKAGLSLNYRGV
jgi:glucose uptake protein